MWKSRLKVRGRSIRQRLAKLLTNHTPSKPYPTTTTFQTQTKVFRRTSYYQSKRQKISWTREWSLPLSRVDPCRKAWCSSIRTSRCRISVYWARARASCLYAGARASSIRWCPVKVTRQSSCRVDHRANSPASSQNWRTTASSSTKSSTTWDIRLKHWRSGSRTCTKSARVRTLWPRESCVGLNQRTVWKRLEKKKSFARKNWTCLRRQLSALIASSPKMITNRSRIMAYGST